MFAIGGHLHISRAETSKRVRLNPSQVTERIEPLPCDEMQLQLGCDFGEPQYEPVSLARAVRVTILRANVVQQALALATAELWSGGPRGVRNLQAMACTSRHPRGCSPDLRLAASGRSGSRLRNDLGCPDRCHGSRFQSIGLSELGRASGRSQTGWTTETEIRQRRPRAPQPVRLVVADLRHGVSE